MAQESFIAIATHALSARIQKGKRRSKYDQTVTILRGDVVMLVSPEPGSPPFVVRIPKEDAKLRYHPGQFLMGMRIYEQQYHRQKSNQVIYQDRWFVIYTNLAIMQRSMIEQIQNVPDDYSQLIPLMERIIITWCEKHDVTEEMERGWNRYFKLRALFTRPGTVSEGNAALTKGAIILKNLVSSIPLPPMDPADDTEGAAEWTT